LREHKFTYLLTYLFFQKISGLPILVYPNLKKKFSYIFVIDKASDFKFGTQLGFTKAHHKIPPEEDVGVALG